jgi:hypothetical protein
MPIFGAFELDIRPGTPDNPASVRVALLRYGRGEDGRLLITPECASFGRGGRADQFPPARTGRDPGTSPASLPGCLKPVLFQKKPKHQS